jgi:hypothetical protein
MLITPSAPTDDQRWRSVEVRMGQLGHRPEGLIEVLHTVQEMFWTSGWLRSRSGPSWSTAR